MISQSFLLSKELSLLRRLSSFKSPSSPSIKNSLLPQSHSLSPRFFSLNNNEFNQVKRIKNPDIKIVRKKRNDMVKSATALKSSTTSSSTSSNIDSEIGNNTPSIEELTNLIINSQKIPTDSTPISSSSSLSSIAFTDRVPAPIIIPSYLESNSPTTITKITSVSEAKEALKVLQKNTDKIWAVDTEVIDLDLSTTGPIGHGKMICFSIYGGDEVSFSSPIFSQNNNSGSTLWVETLGEEGEEILKVFTEFFSDKKYKKIFHNFSFDRHILENHPFIKINGFHGDTMHMARLWDSSLQIPPGRGYSLEGLTSLIFGDHPNKYKRYQKVSMKELFSHANLLKKNPDVLNETFSSTEDSFSSSEIDFEGATPVDVFATNLPNLLELQTNQLYRNDWIEYSARDVVATWGVYMTIKNCLERTRWYVGDKLFGTMFDYYQNIWKDFGDLLTEIEKNGIKIDKKKLESGKMHAIAEMNEHFDVFNTWLAKVRPDLLGKMNPLSSAQLSQLLFGLYKGKQLVNREREFVHEYSEESIQQNYSTLKNLFPFLLEKNTSNSTAENNLSLVPIAKLKEDLQNEFNFTKSISTQDIIMLHDMKLKLNEFVDKLESNATSTSKVSKDKALIKSLEGYPFFENINITNIRNDFVSIVLSHINGNGYNKNLVLNSKNSFLNLLNPNFFYESINNNNISSISDFELDDNFIYKFNKYVLKSDTSTSHPIEQFYSNYTNVLFENFKALFPFYKEFMVEVNSLELSLYELKLKMNQMNQLKQLTPSEVQTFNQNYEVLYQYLTNYKKLIKNNEKILQLNLVNEFLLANSSNSISHENDIEYLKNFKNLFPQVEFKNNDILGSLNYERMINNIANELEDLMLESEEIFGQYSHILSYLENVNRLNKDPEDLASLNDINLTENVINYLKILFNNRENLKNLNNKINYINNIYSSFNKTYDQISSNILSNKLKDLLSKNERFNKKLLTHFTPSTNPESEFISSSTSAIDTILSELSQYKLELMNDKDDYNINIKNILKETNNNNFKEIDRKFLYANSNALIGLLKKENNFFSDNFSLNDNNERSYLINFNNKIKSSTELKNIINHFNSFNKEIWTNNKKIVRFLVKIIDDSVLPTSTSHSIQYNDNLFNRILFQMDQIESMYSEISYDGENQIKSPIFLPIEQNLENLNALTNSLIDLINNFNTLKFHKKESKKKIDTFNEIYDKFVELRSLIKNNIISNDNASSEGINSNSLSSSSSLGLTNTFDFKNEDLNSKMKHLIFAFSKIENHASSSFPPSPSSTDSPFNYSYLDLFNALQWFYHHSKVLENKDYFPFYLQYCNSNLKYQTNYDQLTKKKDPFFINTIEIDPVAYTDGGSAQVSNSVLQKLAGKNFDTDNPSYGLAYSSMIAKGHSEDMAKETCKALASLATINQLETTINNFFIPLNELADDEDRIHCSLNLNTETGRLSSRRPNLQNQPALEKDKFKIRDAFVADQNKTLIVADYGQLELRLLAHITKCSSMIQAFKDGGCFHSRTAVGMYPYIQDAIDRGEVLLEWDYSKGQPTVPLVKDVYGSERRKAKTLNFSIAYGKTTVGLAQDWGISEEEAAVNLNAWYNSRPEVKIWQSIQKDLAKKKNYVLTMTGRYRVLPHASSKDMGAQSHSLRASINTPIQGSAADVVILAMIKIWKNQRLKDLGWKMVLQVHDEIILEGPKESRDEALSIVRNDMENPFPEGFPSLLVHLDVDAKSEDTWYKAK